MTTTTHQSHQDGCLMCAVRALTEGTPATLWTPTEPGQEISGVVLRMGEFETVYGWIPFVDLWTGGTGRVRINAYPTGLRNALTSAAAQVGDTLTVQFDGTRPLEPSKLGRFPFREIKAYSANVQRGH